VPAPVRVRLKRVSCDHAVPYPPDGQAREWWQRLKNAFGTTSSAFVGASLQQRCSRWPMMKWISLRKRRGPSPLGHIALRTAVSSCAKNDAGSSQCPPAPARPTAPTRRPPGRSTRAISRAAGRLRDPRCYRRAPNPKMRRHFVGGCFVRCGSANLPGLICTIGNNSNALGFNNSFCGSPAHQHEFSSRPIAAAQY